MDKTCTKCKTEKSVSEFYKSSKSKDGLRTWCKSCQLNDNKKRESKYNETRRLYRETHKAENRRKKKKYYQENRDKILESNSKWRKSTINGRLNSYKRSALKRNIEWQLSYDEFISFWGKNCSYCGDKIETVGIDRIDSLKGYVLENIVPCCYHCNIIKMHYSREEFLNQINKIWEHTQKLKEI